MALTPADEMEIIDLDKFPWITPTTYIQCKPDVCNRPYDSDADVTHHKANPSYPSDKSNPELVSQKYTKE